MQEWQEDPINLQKVTLEEFQSKVCGGNKIDLVIMNHITWTITAWHDNWQRLKRKEDTIRTGKKRGERSAFQATTVDWFDINKLEHSTRMLDLSITTLKSEHPDTVIALHTVPKTPGLCPGMRSRGSNRMPPYVIHALNAAVRTSAMRKDTFLFDFASWLEGYMTDPQFTSAGVHFKPFVYQNYFKVILNFVASEFADLQ